MPSFGFNTDVHVDGEIYHVQTEPCQRPHSAIETTIFQRGLVQYIHCADCGEWDNIEEQVRAQHGGVINELRRGALRGMGPALTLAWTNPGQSGADGALALAVKVDCAQQPAAQCRVRAMLQREDAPDGAAPLGQAEAHTDRDGCAQLRLEVPGDAGPLRLVLSAERGLSLAYRQFRLS